MKTWRTVVGLAACLPLLVVSASRGTNNPNCAVIVAGAETDSATGSIQNVGQTAIGRADNGSVFMQAGALGCFAFRVPCLPGDVNGDGEINGDDVNDFVRVKLTGVGTPRELCAAKITYAQFIDLLLNP